MFWQDVSVQNVSSGLYWCHWEARLGRREMPSGDRVVAAIQDNERGEGPRARLLRGGDGGGLGLEMN